MFAGKTKKKIVLLGDPTDHGGSVITASSNYRVSGRRAALTGDMVSCPIKGHGVTPILTTRTTGSNGRAMVITGDHAACGAMVIGTAGVGVYE